MYGIHEDVYRKLLDYFQRERGIRKVILFGSRAKDTARYNSDIDLWIMKENRKEKLFKISMTLSEFIPMMYCLPIY